MPFPLLFLFFVLFFGRKKNSRLSKWKVWTSWIKLVRLIKKTFCGQLTPRSSHKKGPITYHRLAPFRSLLRFVSSSAPPTSEVWGQPRSLSGRGPCVVIRVTTISSALHHWRHFFGLTLSVWPRRLCVVYYVIVLRSSPPFRSFCFHPILVHRLCGGNDALVLSATSSLRHCTKVGPLVTVLIVFLLNAPHPTLTLTISCWSCCFYSSFPLSSFLVLY